MRHIIPISGKDSLATALVQKQIEPDLNYEYVFNPTGAELPEVFDWLNKVTICLGKEIVYVGENLIELIEDNNYFLPSRQSRYCTRQCKIEPFEKWIGNDDCIVYYGIRADEDRGGYENSRYPNITPNYPLKKQGFGINEVYEIINHAGLKPPTFFWKEMYEKVVNKVGGEHILKSILNEWQIDYLFCWRTRANCYFCFNQKKAEWVGLMEFHPELFENAKRLEVSESIYYWNGQNYPLTKIEENKESIKNKHFKRLLKTVMKIKYAKLYKQSSIFDMDTEDGMADYFKTTSCGLFCGK